MRSDLGYGIGIALLALATATASENVFQPGVRHVCVPNADHSGWDCGTVDKPPPGYRKPAAETADDAKITDPDAAAVKPGRDAAPATNTETSSAQPAPAQESSRVSPPPPPFLANPNRPRFPLPAPQPSAAPSGTGTRTTGVAVASDRTATPVSTTTPPSAATDQPGSAPARLLLAALPGARAFAALNAGHYTLQLTGAASAAAFPELIEHLAIDYRRCYVLRVERDERAWWLLVYGDFTDLAAARAAARNLPHDPALAAVWPRRVGFLQAEFVPNQNR